MRFCSMAFDASRGKVQRPLRAAFMILGEPPVRQLEAILGCSKAYGGCHGRSAPLQSSINVRYGFAARSAPQGIARQARFDFDSAGTDAGPACCSWVGLLDRACGFAATRRPDIG